MLKRPEPKKLSAEAQAAITRASSMQTGKTQIIKSYDPDYPVFDVPVNQRVLIYVPNHTCQLEDGTIGLRMDKFAAHPVLDGRSYGNVRCVNGVVSSELGLDGTCPLCEAINEQWELYRLDYADIAKSRGIDPNGPEAQDALRQDRMELVNKMTIRQADVWYTFPIVVIDCEERDGVRTVTPKRDVDGRIKGTPMWYSIRERTYLEKWGAGFDSLDDTGYHADNPAGLWAVLNFTYQSKSGSYDKMSSAKALKVTFKAMNGYEKWAEYFDQQTASWTPEKAQECVVLDAIRDMEETKQVVVQLMKPVRDKLALYALSSRKPATAPVVEKKATADALLAGFGVDLQPCDLTSEMPDTI